jgi:hypothetical protein
MTYTYDLIHQPWIPCREVEGRRAELGLAGVLERVANALGR